MNSSSSLAEEEQKIFSKSNKEFFEKKASQIQSEGTSQVVDTRTCFKCNQMGHIARKCTVEKPKTEIVKVQQRKDDKKGKAPMYVEKKVVQTNNLKEKSKHVKKLVPKQDKFYKRGAETQQVWKPKVVTKIEKKVSIPEVKNAEESMTIDYDANFPPLNSKNFKIQVAKVTVVPKADKAWVDSMFD